MEERRYFRPQVKEVYGLLGKHDALIVHFSGCPKQYGCYEFAFPEDLTNVADGKAMGGVSCSVVKPNGVFYGMDGRNGSGTIGVILGLQARDSLVDVDGNDCGSYVEDGVRKTTRQNRDLSITDLEESIPTAPNVSNEWVIRNYHVVGLFVALDNTCNLEVWGDMSSDDTRLECQAEALSGPVDIAFDTILNIFSIPIYGFQKGVLCRYRDEGWRPILHSELYSSP